MTQNIKKLKKNVGEWKFKIENSHTLFCYLKSELYVRSMNKRIFIGN